MSKMFFSLLFVVAIATGCRIIESPPMPMTFRSGERIQIVLPDRSADKNIAAHLRAAAEMLAEALQAAAGTQAEVIAETKAVPHVKSIFVGNTAALRKAGVNTQKFAPLESLTMVKDGNLYIAGADFKNDPASRPAPLDIRHYSLGSFRGCVLFAERFLDVRFLLPGKQGMDLAVGKAPISLPGNLMLRQKPWMELSHARNYFPFYNYSNQNHGNSRYKIYGGHSYYDAVPRKLYEKEHPEYFAFLSGRRDARANHLCISNPAVQELIFQEMVRRFDSGMEVVELGQTDGYKPCECEKCKKLFGVDDEGEKLWILHRNLAQRLLKERPGKKVLIISYSFTANPPRTFQKFPANVMVELCRSTPEDFEVWKDYEVPQGFTVYIYNWGTFSAQGFTPKKSLEYCADQIRMFKANNVKGMYRCGFGELFGLEGPIYYVYGKMLENPDANEWKLADEFLRRAYHESYTPMRAFFELLNRRLELYGRHEESDPRVLIAATWPPNVLDRLNKNLERAEKLAASSKVRGRLALVRDEFDYLRNLAEIFHCYFAYEINRNQQNFDQLAARLDWRKSFISARFNVQNRNKNIPGWPTRLTYFDFQPRTCVTENGWLRGRLGAPVNWDTALLRKHNVLPGTERKKLKAAKLSGNVPTSEFDSGVWKNVSWHTMRGLQLQTLRDAPRVKVAYNEKALFFAFDCEIDPAKKFIQFGKDGPVWSQDCVEIFVDPTATRDRYFHFIAGPESTSTYDEAFGLISDVFHPKYNSPDSSWNGRWKHHSSIKGNRWELLVEIPFTTLLTEPPVKGDRYLMNLARERYFPDEIQPELSSWSPNFEECSFHNREIFGELIFD